jgi:hypothetical protein
LAAFLAMMERGVSVREHREIEAGDRTTSLDTYQRNSDLYGWPQTFVSRT